MLTAWHCHGMRLLRKLFKEREAAPILLLSHKTALSDWFVKARWLKWKAPSMLNCKIHYKADQYSWIWTLISRRDLINKTKSAHAHLAKIQWHSFHESQKLCQMFCITMPPRYVHNSVSPPRDTKLVHDAVPQCHRNVVLKATQEMSTIVVSRGSLSVVSLARTLYLVTGARAQICPSIPLIPSASYTPKSWHNEAKQTAFAFL